MQQQSRQEATEVSVFTRETTIIYIERQQKQQNNQKGNQSEVENGRSCKESGGVNNNAEQK